MTARTALFVALVTMPLPWGLPMNLALVVAAVATLGLVLRRNGQPGSVAGWLLLAFSVAAGLSALVAIDPWCGFAGPWDLLVGKLRGRPAELWCGLRGLLDIARTSLVFWVATQVLDQSRHRRIWLMLIVVVAAIVGFGGLSEYTLGHRTGGEFLRDAAIGHSNHTAAFLVITLPAVAAAAALRALPVWARAAAALTLAAGLVAFVLTQSLTGWIAALIVAGVSLSRVRGRGGVAVAIAGAIIAAALAVPAWTKLTSAWLQMSVGSRLTWWDGALRVIAEHPVLGIGPRNFILIDPVHYGFKPSFHAHNQYLNLAAEQGLVGLVLFLAVLGAVAWRLHATRRLRADDMDTVCWHAAAAALIGLVIVGLASTPYHTRIAFMFWAVVGLFYAQFARRPALASNAPTPASRPSPT